MNGQLCMVGLAPNFSRLFYYGVTAGLHIEIIDRRNRDMKHLVRLVDADGNAVPIPPGARFEHVRSGEEMHLMENHLRSVPATQ